MVYFNRQVEFTTHEHLNAFPLGESMSVSLIVSCISMFQWFVNLVL